MGCDIHMFVEKRVNGEWVTADTWFDDDEEYGGKSIYKWGEGENAIDIISGPIYHDRNYSLFSILGDVRNGSGFAGTDTGDGFVPIHPNRGLPVDVCEVIKDQSDGWDIDGHSHNWATLQELMDYDWTQKTKRRGWVSSKQYVRFKVEGRPEEWSGSVSGGNIKHISHLDMDRYVRRKMGMGSKSPLTWRTYHDMKVERFGVDAMNYTKVEWEVDYYDVASDFLSHVVPKLWRMGHPDDVRIVYWFDN